MEGSDRKIPLTLGRPVASSRYEPLPPPVRPLPRHIAFIMDGNGRWARRQGLRRLRGHERGAASLREITRYCARIGVGEITIYALSTENYTRRPRAEIAFLMRLLKSYLIDERPELSEGNIRLRAIGRVEELPADVRRELDTTIAASSGHDGMTLRLALNYGGRGEILDAVKSICHDVAAGRLDAAGIDRLTEDDLRARFHDAGMSDPELVVRTAGETRLSNFLLWQASYAEIVVTDVLWPEFAPHDLDIALRSFATRGRKFGGLGPEDAERDPSGV